MIALIGWFPGREGSPGHAPRVRHIAGTTPEIQKTNALPKGGKKAGPGDLALP